MATEQRPAGSAGPYAIVASEFIRTGGMDRANLALASYLADQGHVVHLIGHHADPDLLAKPNVRFHRVPMPLRSYFLGGFLLERTGRRVCRQVAMEGGRAVVNGGNCSFGDINWVHYIHAAYEQPAARGWLRRLKNIWAHRLFLAAEAKSIKAARIVIANSNRTRQDLIDHLGVPPERIHTVYLGIESGAFVPASAQERSDIRRRLQWPAERPIAMFIGALGDRRKGFDTLFSAWLKLCAEPSWDVDLVVIGIGGELSAWKQRAATSNLSSRFRFLGFRNDVPELLRGVDVLVAPTRYEPYGLGVQEALCCGLPALVSADAGVAERYPQELRSLLLPNCEDVNDLVSRLIAWRADTVRLRELARSFGDLLRQRTWEQTAREMIGIAGKTAHGPSCRPVLPAIPRT